MFLNEERPPYKNEFKVTYTVLKGKDASTGTAVYANEEDARKFFNDIIKDDEVISAKLRKFVGPDSSRDEMGGFAKHEGSAIDIEKYTHPAYFKKGDLEGQEANIKMFLGTPSFQLKKRGFTSDSPYFEEGLEENDKVLDEMLNEDFIEDLIAKIESKYGVLALPDKKKDDQVIIYPDKDPGEGNLVTRTSQYITVKDIGLGGGVNLINVFGMEEGLDNTGLDYGKTSQSGFGIYLPSYPPSVGWDKLNTIITSLQQGLKGVAKSQADFYSKNKGYYKQDGRIGVGLSSQPRK